MYEWNFIKTETDVANLLARKNYRLQVQHWTLSAPAGCISHNETAYLVLRLPKPSGSNMQAPGIMLRDLDMRNPRPSIYNILWKPKQIKQIDGCIQEIPKEIRCKFSPQELERAPTFDWSKPYSVLRRKGIFYDTGSRKIISSVKAGGERHAY